MRKMSRLTLYNTNSIPSIRFLYYFSHTMTINVDIHHCGICSNIARQQSQCILKTMAQVFQSNDNPNTGKRTRSRESLKSTVRPTYFYKVRRRLSCSKLQSVQQNSQE